MQPAKLTYMKLLNTNQQVQDNTMTFRTGYGQVSNVGINATIGAQVEVNVDIITTAVIESKVLEACQSVAKTYNKNEQFSSDYKKYGGGGGLGFVFGLFGIFGGGGYVNEQKKTSSTINQDSSQENKSLANAISSLTETKVRVTGKIKVTGITYVPSEANVFIEIMTVKGKDQHGKDVNLKIVSSSAAKVADSEGNQTGQITGGKLDIVPL